MRERGAWDGVLAIARFNWPWYLAALAVLAAAVTCLAIALPLPVFAWFAAAAAGWFLVGSLAASHWIYDRSDLYRFHWLDRALARPYASRFVFCHTGFDECSALLAQKLPGKWRVLDHHAPATMTEASLQRARQRQPQTPAEPEAHDAWPIGDGGTDAVFAILTIHELREPAQLTAWFREAKRCLAPGGRVVLVEHARDLANFLAFGPGFRHFHAPHTWQRAWQAAGLG